MNCALHSKSSEALLFRENIDDYSSCPCWRV